ncbi:hypothetical protein VPH35_025093 [Triticum aestivum]
MAVSARHGSVQFFSSSTLMEYLLQRASSTSSSSHGGSQQQQQRSSSIKTDQQQQHRQRSSSINTGRGAGAARASSTGGRGETEEKQDAAPRASTTGGHAGREGAPRRRVGARRGLAGDHGGRARAAVHRIVEAGSGDAVVGSRWRTGGSSRWTRGSTRRTRGSSRTMRGSSCSTGSWWQIPAMPVGNRPGRGSRRRRSGRRWRSKYLATAAALKVPATEAEHFLVGGNHAAWRRRPLETHGRRRRKKTGVEGLVCDCFETTRAFL